MVGSQGCSATQSCRVEEAGERCRRPEALNLKADFNKDRSRAKAGSWFAGCLKHANPQNLQTLPPFER